MFRPSDWWRGFWRHFSSGNGRIGLFVDEFNRFPVLTNTRLNHDSCILRVGLRPISPFHGEIFTPLPQFPPSYCVMVQPTSGGSIMKPYTPVNTNVDSFDLLVKAYTSGTVSQALFNTPKGEHLWIRGPIKKYPLNPSHQWTYKVLFIAGGTGITPILQILRFINTQKEGLPREITLIYANKTKADIVLKAELDELKASLASKISTVNFIYLLEEAEDGALSGRVTSDLLRRLNLQRTPETTNKVLICGPPGMNATLLGTADNKGILETVGYGRDEIYKF